MNGCTLAASEERGTNCSLVCLLDALTGIFMANKEHVTTAAYLPFHVNIKLEMSLSSYTVLSALFKETEFEQKDVKEVRKRDAETLTDIE